MNTIFNSLGIQSTIGSDRSKNNFNVVLNKFNTIHFHEWLLVGLGLLYCDEEIQDNNMEIDDMFPNKIELSYFDIWCKWSISHSPFDDDDCEIYWNYMYENREKTMKKIIESLIKDQRRHNLITNKK